MQNTLGCKNIMTVSLISCFIAGGIASIADLWRAEARPYLHALQCMISIGGIITPFIIEPFLARGNNQVYLIHVINVFSRCRGYSLYS